jgi:hypothetical protein
MKSKYYTPLFLLLELILYILILTTGGDLLRYSSYLSIVLCFLFGVLHIRKDNRNLIAGQVLTLCADTCLVLCQPIRKFAGMVFFFFAQSSYGIYLHRHHPNRRTQIIRAILMFLSILLCIVVLGDKTDALAIVSIGYYAHLIMNLVDSIRLRKKYPLMPWAFVLFLFCDTIIGLQVMSGGYLPIPAGSFIHNLLFSNFNLAWLFYLPSQVMIALSAQNHKERP